MSMRQLTMAVMASLVLLTVTTATVSSTFSRIRAHQRTAPPRFVSKFRGGAVVTKIPQQQEQQLGATIPNEIFNLVKSIVGAGVLGLSAGIAAFGNAPGALVPATLLILGIGILSMYGFALIGRVCAYTNSTSYREAWSKAVSPKTSWMPATACLLVTFCSTVAYSMILSDTLPQLVSACWGVTIQPTRTQALLGVTILALLPLCSLKDFSKLAPFSLVGICGMIYTVLAMAIRYLQSSYKLPNGKFLPLVQTQPSFGTKTWDPNSSFVFISMLSTAFMAHYNAPKFYHELRNKSLPRYYTVVSTSFGISMLIFIAVASLGFLTFGESAKGLVLHNYATQDGLMSVSRIAVALSILFSYPLAFVGVRDGVLDLAKITNRSNAMLNTLTVVLLTVVTCLAFILKDLRIVLAFGGATWGNAVIYLFSTYMFCSLAKKEKQLLLHKEVPWATATGVLGLTMGIIGTVRAIKSM